MGNESNILTIAIPTFNRPSQFQIAIESVIKQYRTGIDILISDNSENEDTKRIVEDKFLGLSYVSYVKNSKNIGPDANFLQCLRIGKGRFVLMLSDDDVLLDGAVDEIINLILDFPNIPIIYLNHYAWGRFIGDKLPTGSEVEVNRFISTISYDLTYISSIVFNKNKFLEVNDPEQSIGSFLLITQIAVEMIGRNRYGIITKRECVKGQKIPGKYGGFDIYRVYAANWKEILVSAYHNGYIRRFTVRRAFSRTIYSFLIKSTIAARNKENMKGYLKNKKLLFEATNTYPIAWLLLYPTMFLPRSIMYVLMVLHERISNLEK